MNKGIIIFLSVVVVAFVGLIFISKQQDAAQVGAKGSSNTYGKLDSPVQLTEYLDFQCEACAAFYPTVQQVKEKYKDRVKFQFKNFPISTSHQNALAAAAAAQAAAKQGKFLQMHDSLYENQQEWATSSNRDELFTGYAKTIGLNMKKYQKDVSSAETKQIIQTDLADVRRLGGDGTPTFALNGKKIENPENTVEAFSKVLDEALANAGK